MTRFDLKKTAGKQYSLSQAIIFQKSIGGLVKDILHFFGVFNFISKKQENKQQQNYGFFVGVCQLTLLDYKTTGNRGTYLTDLRRVKS